MSPMVSTSEGSALWFPRTKGIKQPVNSSHGRVVYSRASHWGVSLFGGTLWLEREINKIPIPKVAP